MIGALSITLCIAYINDVQHLGVNHRYQNGIWLHLIMLQFFVRFPKLVQGSDVQNQFSKKRHLAVE
jgi:hypothetical protein